QVEPTMGRGDGWGIGQARKWKGEVVRVIVDNVELTSALVDHSELDHRIRHRILGVYVQPQPAGTTGHEVSASSRIAAGEQGHVMAPPHQLLSQHGHHAFCPAVKRRRYGFDQRSHHRNSQTYSPFPVWPERRVVVLRLSPLCRCTAGK